MLALAFSPLGLERGAIQTLGKIERDDESAGV
jgi:hypothetical protein